METGAFVRYAHAGSFPPNRKIAGGRRRGRRRWTFERLDVPINEVHGQCVLGDLARMNSTSSMGVGSTEAVIKQGFGEAIDLEIPCILT